MNNPPEEEAPASRNEKTALVDGVKIHGCGQCGHNYSRVVIPLLPPTHYCNSVVDARANDMVIFNPIDIPDTCPFLIQERKPAHVFIDPPMETTAKETAVFETVWIARSVIIMLAVTSLIAILTSYPMATLNDAIYVIACGVLLGIVTSPALKWLALRFGRKTP